MQRNRLLAGLIVGCLVGWSGAAADDVPQKGPTHLEFRIWTSDNGYVRKLAFLELKGEHVRFQRPEGTTLSVPLHRLCDGDQQLVARTVASPKYRNGRIAADPSNCYPHASSDTATSRTESRTQLVSIVLQEPTDSAAESAREVELTTSGLRDELRKLLPDHAEKFADVCELEGDASESEWISRLAEGLSFADQSKTIEWKVTVRQDADLTGKEEQFSKFIKDDLLNVFNLPTAQWEQISVKVEFSRESPKEPSVCGTDVTTQLVTYRAVRCWRRFRCCRVRWRCRLRWRCWRRIVRGCCR